MKEMEELILPGDIFYTRDHEWVYEDGELARIGISDYAQDQLGDIVFVELPEVGEHFDKGEEFGTLESVKAVSEIYLPIGGEIVAVNGALEESPELLNENSYENWIIEVRFSRESDFNDLLSRDEYLDLLKE